MSDEIMIERLFQALITGDRATARQLVDEAGQQHDRQEDLAHEVFWPLLEMIQSLFRADQLGTLAHHYATRLLRGLAHHAQGQYQFQKRNGRKVLLFCGESEADELAGQITADLLEADGYEMYFGGGGVANDEILAEIGEHRPDILLMFSSGPSDAPNIRQLIDHIRSVDACPNLQIVVGGGVFNRAEGLAEEIGADLWARTPRELIEALDHQRKRRAEPGQRTVGRHRGSGPHSAVA